MKLIQFLVESDNGHDEKLIPEEKVEGEVGNELKENKWVTIEKQDGETKILTDTPKTEADDKEWKNLFGKAPESTNSNPIKSVTSTNKMKGG